MFECVLWQLLLFSLAYFTSNKCYDAPDRFMFHGAAVMSSGRCLQGESAQLAVPQDLQLMKIIFVSQSCTSCTK